MGIQSIIKPATIEEAFDLDVISITEERDISLINNDSLDFENGQKIESNLIVNTNPFIVSNTTEVNLDLLRKDCIIPVFSKDNEKTIAHQEFIEIAQDSISKVFPNIKFEQPEIRVSHQIKGRIPDAIHKNVKELLDHEKTQYFERMAFIIKIPEITSSVNGNQLDMTIGGVRSYNLENLYNKKSMERFKFFIGFQNQVCMNLCVWSDGFVEDLRVSSADELQARMIQVMQSYDAEKHLSFMKDLPNYALTESQFAQVIGKSRLYHYLPKQEKAQLPSLLMNDGNVGTIARDYYLDNSFSRDEAGNINLWNLYNLFTSANKSSYIDTFLDRSVNAFDFTKGLKNALNGFGNHGWFLE